MFKLLDAILSFRFLFGAIAALLVLGSPVLMFLVILIIVVLCGVAAATKGKK